MHNSVGATYEERQDERDSIQAAMGCLAQLGKEINSATIDCWIAFLIQDFTYGGDEVQEHAQEIAMGRGVNIFERPPGYRNCIPLKVALNSVYSLITLIQEYDT